MKIRSGTSTRVLVVGHKPYFELHMPETHDNIIIHKVDFYHGVTNNIFNVLESFKPDVLFAFRPELVPISLLLSFAGKKIGFSSEIFPKLVDGKLIGDEIHQSKFEFFDNSATRKFDQLYHYDVSSKSFLENVGLHFTDFPPYPLSTKLFDAVEVERDIDVLFIGRISPRRYKLLEPLKNKNIRFISIDHGFHGQDLINLLSRSKIILNIHAENHISFEPRTLIGAAAGAIVVTEPIPMPRWLEECPFIFTNDLCSNLLCRIDQALNSFDRHISEAQRFRNFLRDICSADTFLDKCLSR